MKVIIKNCNNIDNGEIKIIKEQLNIRFGINGTGKSTVSKAIEYNRDVEKLQDLMPFKLHEKNEECLKSSVELSESIKSVFVFNEEYVGQFVFQKDELVENSFDIFINTPAYKKKVEEIELIIFGIKKVFEDHEDLNIVINDLEELSSNFKISRGGISKSSKGYKSLVNGNKIENIPKELEEYKVFLQSDLNVEWLNWQNGGAKFLDISDKCPYCIASIKTKKDKIIKVSTEYDKNHIKNLKLLIDVINKLGGYFSDDTLKVLKELVTQKDGLNEDQEKFLCKVKEDIDDLIEKFKNLRNLSSFDFGEIDNIEIKLKSLQMDIDLYEKLNSKKTNEIINNLNDSLEIVIGDVSNLKTKIAIYQAETTRLIQKNQKNIDQFLKNAGYKYKVLIINEKNNYKLKLKHIDLKNALIHGDQHLSFGEKNAFALILFMYEALSKNPDLIILDDPISSFDKNKKYAIMHALFRGDECFRGKTVLMLTHDIEPIIDTVKILHRNFNEFSNAGFLQAKDYQLSEINILRDDILTFSQICNKIVFSEEIDEIIRLIYLRRKFEIVDDKGNEYQILCDLIHGRDKETSKKYRQDQDDNLSDEKFDEDFIDGFERVKKVMDTFDFDKILGRILNLEELKNVYKSCKNGFEKLQLFRIINKNFEIAEGLDDVMNKFINETYHIENELVAQLDPVKFDLVPEFIIEECDKYILNF